MQIRRIDDRLYEATTDDKRVRLAVAIYPMDPRQSTEAVLQGFAELLGRNFKVPDDAAIGIVYVGKGLDAASEISLALNEARDGELLGIAVKNFGVEKAVLRYMDRHVQATR